VAVTGLALCSCGKGPVATVNGQKVSPREFYTYAAKGQMGAVALGGIMLEQIILQAAQKAGITVSDDEVDARLEKVAATLKKNTQQQDEGDAANPYDSGASLEDEVRRQFLTWDDYRWEVRVNMLVEKLCAKDVQVTEEKLKNYFEQKRATVYDKPDWISLHLMAAPTNKEALEARKKLLEGEEFEAVAQASTLKWQGQGGQFEEVGRDPNRLPLVFFDALWNLNTGEITQPIKYKLANKDAFYLARLDAKSPAEKADYEKIKEQVREDYLRDNSKPQDLYLLQLRQDAKVEIKWPQFRTLEQAFGKAPPSPSAPGGPAPAVGKGETTKPETTPTEKPPQEKGNAPPSAR